MENDRLFTRAEICAIVAAPEDAVVFWLRQGLLAGVQKQARAHLRFSENEAKIAAILNETRHIGMNVAAMRSLVVALRNAMQVYASYPKGDRWFDRAIDNERVDTINSLSVGDNFSRWEGVIVLVRQEGGDWSLGYSLDDSGLRAPSAIVVNLDYVPLNWPAEERS